MILLCNDDGFNADGLRTLYRELSKEDEVIIVAPETEQSAMGHAITLTQPLKVRKVEEEGRFMGYAVNGTPAYCVKLAIALLQDEPPRLVVSGINLGGNLGICALYSGTVSAATEAMIMGVPSIAVSLAPYANPDFNPAAKFTRKLISKVLEKGMPQGVVLNVNVPPVPELKLGPASERAVSVETDEVNVSLNRFAGGPVLPLETREGPEPGTPLPVETGSVTVNSGSTPNAHFWSAHIPYRYV